MHVFSLTVQVGEGFPSPLGGQAGTGAAAGRERSLRELYYPLGRALRGEARGEHASRPPGLRAPRGAVAAGQLGPSWASGGSTARGGGGAEELRGEHLESLARRVAPSEGRPRRAAFGGAIGSSGRRARTTAGRLLHVSEACQQRVARRTCGGWKVAYVVKRAGGWAYGARRGGVGARGPGCCRMGLFLSKERAASCNAREPPGVSNICRSAGGAPLGRSTVPPPGSWRVRAA